MRKEIVVAAAVLTLSCVAQVRGARLQRPFKEAPAGTRVALSCINFAADATVTIRFSGTMDSVIGTGRTSSAGTATPSISWTVPPVAPGTYVLTAIDNRSRYPVRARFVVQ